MTIHGFAETRHIRMSAEYIDARPDRLMDDMPASSTHWRCVLRRGNRRMTVYFSQGPAISREPTVADLLNCLASDWTDQPFEDWARDLGFDLDSRKAERIYRAVVRQSAALGRLLDGDLDTLLYKTDRL